MIIRGMLILALSLAGLGKVYAEVLIGPSGDPVDAVVVEDTASIDPSQLITPIPTLPPLPTPILPSRTIGLDARHQASDLGSLAAGSAFSQFRATLTGLGYAYQAKSTFESADLLGLDALVVYQPYTINTNPEFSPSELSAIHSFVAAGGGLLVVAEGGSGGTITSLNELVAPYGVAYSTDLYDGSGRTVNQFWYHPVTKGLGAVTVDYQRGMIFDPPAVDLTVQGAGLVLLVAAGGGDDILAVREGDGGAGNVVCVTDSNMWADSGGDAYIDTTDNRLLLQNILRYIVGLNPYDCSGPIPALFFRSVFESSTECWTQVSLAPVFAEPGFSREQGGIGLSPNGSAGAFGYWNSPVLSVNPGAYVVTWTVTSTADPELCPQFRLRINDNGGRDALYRAIESRLAGENSPGPSDKRYFIVYDVPVGVSEITLAFDLLSFDGTDDLNSTIRLREVTVTPLF